MTEYLVSAGIFAGVWARTRMDVLPKGADSGGFATAGIFGAGAKVTVSRLKKRNDVGRAVPETGWEDASRDLGTGSGREAGRA